MTVHVSVCCDLGTKNLVTLLFIGFNRIPKNFALEFCLFFMALFLQCLYSYFAQSSLGAGALIFFYGSYVLSSRMNYVNVALLIFICFYVFSRKILTKLSWTQQWRKSLPKFYFVDSLFFFYFYLFCKLIEKKLLFISRIRIYVTFLHT